MSRPIAIIQARMGSRRLPGKVLADLAGAPVLVRMIERVRAAETLAGIVIATTEDPADEAIRDLAVSLGLGCFVGSVDDVLARYVQASEAFGADPIVRLTADCPLIDPALVDRCVATFLATPGCDYLALGGEFPDGLDTEVVARAALLRAHAEARLPSEREHVTPYVWKHPDLFHCASVPFPERLGQARWTVDQAEDLAFVRAVYAHLYRPGHVFGWRDVITLVTQVPALRRLNAGIERNAGYRHSLTRDAASGGGG